MNLLNPQRISPATKERIRQRTNDCDSFESTGLGLDIMNQKEFWAGSVFTQSSHGSWKDFLQTTHESQNATLTEVFEGKDNNNSITSRKFQVVARRNAVFSMLKTGTYARFAIRDSIVEEMSARFKKGNYESEMESVQADLDEDVVEGDASSLDDHLLANYAFVSDAVELSKKFSDKVEAKDSAAADARVGMDDNAWFLSELNHDVDRFKKLVGDQEKARGTLAGKEKEYETTLRGNVKQATEGFTNKFMPMITFRSDEDAILNAVASELETRENEIAKDCSCTRGDILRCCILDLSSFGAPTVGSMDFAERLAVSFAGATGLALLLCSDVPAGKGRTGTPKKAKPKQAAVAAAAAAAGDGAEAERSEPVDDLPAAPSDFHVYADKGVMRALQMQHFQKVLQIGCSNTSRYAESLTFKYTGNTSIRVAGIQPASNSAWQHMDLMKNLEVSGIAPPAEVVDFGPQSASQARQGTISMGSWKSCQNRNSRCQRGSDMYKRLYTDLRKAADALTAEDGKVHPVMCVDPTCWGGDSMIGFAPQFSCTISWGLRSPGGQVFGVDLISRRVG